MRTTRGRWAVAAVLLLAGALGADERRDTLESLRAEAAEVSPQTVAEHRALAKRFAALATDEGREEARRLWQAVVDRLAPDDSEARAALGYVEYVHEIPEAIAFRRHAFLEAVEALSARRWLRDPYELAVAARAWQETLDHARALGTREGRAVDAARARLVNDPTIASLHVAATWARPYLVCYLSARSLSDHDVVRIEDLAAREAARRDLEPRARRAERVLAETGKVLQGLHAEWMRRYAEPLGLRDLMEPYGGRPDLPDGVRTFPDGLPLVVLVFDDAKALERSVGPNRLAPGGFSPRDGAVYRLDAPDAERQDDLEDLLASGTAQLQWWLTRQRNRWKMPRRSDDFLTVGLGEWLGAARIDRRRDLVFTGESHRRIREMRRASDGFRKVRKEYPLFPLERLTRFTGYAQVDEYAQSTWEVPPMTGILLFREQAYALVAFLDRPEHRERFLRLLDLATSREEVGLAFRKAFDVRDEADWAPLDEAFARFLREDLLGRDPAAIAYDPPPLEVWD